jgi:hypothetical protein
VERKVAIDHGDELVNIERLRDGLSGSVGEHVSYELV